MGGCASKPPSSARPNPYAPRDRPLLDHPAASDDVTNGTRPHQEPLPPPSPFFPLYSPAVTPVDEAKATPRQRRRRAPPSPAKHIAAVLRRKRGTRKKKGEEEEEGEAGEMDKKFGYSREVTSRLELGEEVGRGHFGYTCSAVFKKGEWKGSKVAVKVIPKSKNQLRELIRIISFPHQKMTTAIAIEDVRREVKILRALTGHKNLVRLFDAFEDTDNVYVVMELCEGGELLDQILSRGGKYSEDEAKAVMAQILDVVAFCHLQGVVHRDLKPENFLFASKDTNSPLKVIDFGLSDFVRPDEKLNDIVGSAYYVAPEVLHRCYGTEADVWSVGVIAYILLCGSRPFWARTESQIFRAILKVEPGFDGPPWPSISSEAKDFVKRLLNKDPRKRMTAAQALGHPWIRNFDGVKVPLDIHVLRQMKAYMRSSSLRKAALQALSKTLIVDELYHLKEQFALLQPNKNGTMSLENITGALMRNATDAMKDSRIFDYLPSLNPLRYKRMNFEEFCAATLSVHQLESLGQWEWHARSAYEHFEKDRNKPIAINELASELGLSPSIPIHDVFREWIRPDDGKLSFHGFVKLLHGVSSRCVTKAL